MSVPPWVYVEDLITAEQLGMDSNMGDFYVLKHQAKNWGRGVPLVELLELRDEALRRGLTLKQLQQLQDAQSHTLHATAVIKEEPIAMLQQMQDAHYVTGEEEAGTTGPVVRRRPPAIQITDHRRIEK